MQNTISEIEVEQKIRKILGHDCKVDKIKSGLKYYSYIVNNKYYIKLFIPKKTGKFSHVNEPLEEYKRVVARIEFFKDSLITAPIVKYDIIGNTPYVVFENLTGFKNLTVVDFSSKQVQSNAILMLNTLVEGLNKSYEKRSEKLIEKSEYIRLIESLEKSISKLKQIKPRNKSIDSIIQSIKKIKTVAERISTETNTYRLLVVHKDTNLSNIMINKDNTLKLVDIESIDLSSAELQLGKLIFSILFPKYEIGSDDLESILNFINRYIDNSAHPINQKVLLYNIILQIPLRVKMYVTGIIQNTELLKENFTNTLRFIQTYERSN